MSIQHQKDVAAVAGGVVSAVASMALGADPAAIGTWFWTAIDAMLARIQVGYAVNRNSSLHYLTRHATLNGAAVDVVPGSLDVARVRERLRIVGPVGFKSGIEAGQSPDEALRHMATNMGGVADEYVRNGDRDVIARTAIHGQGVAGWRRRLSGRKACGFCAMLASRGAVYVNRKRATVAKDGMAYHPHCHCWAEPLYERDRGKPEPREVRDLEAQWKRITSGGWTPQQAQQLWRNWWENRPPPRWAQERGVHWPDRPHARMLAGLPPTPDVSRLSVTRLRAMVADRGITVPTGLRQPALRRLVDDLERGVNPTTAREAAVRTILAERRQVADLLGEVDQALFDGATARRLEFWARQAEGLPAEMKASRTLAAALRSGDEVAIRREMTALARAGKVKATGRVVDAPDLTGARGLSTVPAVRRIQIENRIRQAYAEIRAGLPEGPQRRGWVGLADVREHPLIRDLDRAEVDGALRSFIAERRPGAFIESEMNQSALTARDRAAAVRLGGEDNHFLRLDEPSLRPLPSTRTTTRAAAAGDVVPLDRRVMDLALDEGQPAGTLVQVIRPGYETAFEGKTLSLSRASVQPASAEQIAARRAVTPAKAAKKAAPRKAAVPDLTGARGLSTDPAVRAVQIENRIRQAYAAVADRKTRAYPGQVVSVRLDELRTELGIGVSRSDIDAAIMRVSREDGAYLAMNEARLPDLFPPAERAAAITRTTPTGQVEYFTRLEIRDPSLRPLPGTVAKAAPAKAAKAAPAKKVAAPKKAAAPKAPPAPERMSIPALKTELQRTLDATDSRLVLDGVPKPVLARWVERARELPASEMHAEVARWQLAVVERRRGLAELLAEADGLIDSQASASAMAARGSARLRRLEDAADGWPDLAEARKVVAAMATGDPAKIRRALAAAERKLGLEQVGPDAGQTIRFEKAMRSAPGKTGGYTGIDGTRLVDGKTYTVVRPGYSIEIGGERVYVTRAVLEEVDDVVPTRLPPKMSSLPRTAATEDLRAAAMATNPRYGRSYEGPITPEIEALGAGYTQNCTRSVIAYELRRRGVSVTAGAGTTAGDITAAYVRTFRLDGKYATRVSRDLGRDMSAREIAREVESWPLGARGIVTIKGHTLNVERDAITGRAVFIDTQAASSKNPVMDLAAFMRRARSRGAPTDRWMAVARVDDLEVSDYGLRYVESPDLDLADGQVGKTEFPQSPDSEYSSTYEEIAAMTPDDTYP